MLLHQKEMSVENWDLIIWKDRLPKNNQSSLLPRNSILNLLKYKYICITKTPVPLHPAQVDLRN